MSLITKRVKIRNYGLPTVCSIEIPLSYKRTDKRGTFINKKKKIEIFGHIINLEGNISFNEEGLNNIINLIHDSDCHNVLYEKDGIGQIESFSQDKKINVLIKEKNVIKVANGKYDCFHFLDNLCNVYYEDHYIIIKNQFIYWISFKYSINMTLNELKEAQLNVSKVIIDTFEC